jgi:hypothetical protein
MLAGEVRPLHTTYTPNADIPPALVRAASFVRAPWHPDALGRQYYDAPCPESVLSGYAA